VPVRLPGLLCRTLPAGKRSDGRSHRKFGWALLVVGSLAAVVLLLAVAGAFDGAFAQGSPFGMPRPSMRPAPEVGGMVGWLLAKQAVFYRSLSGLIRAARVDGTAVWGLLGVSFIYGIFHAAGPGHGKGVISSYLLANEETWRRGVTLSFASALLQALVAVVLVGIAALVFNATKKTMDQAGRVIEIASYGLIALVGARLTWVKGRAFIRAIQAWYAELGGGHIEHVHVHAPHIHIEHDHGHATHAHAHSHTHAHAEHAHHDNPGHDHAAHQHDDHCGHSHGPDPEQLAGRGGWQRGLWAIIAVGLRPCSGAILVLVFALAQGLFWAGVASTFVMGLGTAITVAAIATFAVLAKNVAKRIAVHRAGGGALVMLGIETGAALLVLVFGIALLAGYMVTERMI
jgi:nickel/cobalt exporter